MQETKSFFFTPDQEQEIDLENCNQEHLLHDACVNGYYTLARRLIVDYHVKPNNNGYDKFGKSPLHYAARNGHADLVQLLLNYGACINHKDKGGFTALHVSVLYKNFAVTQLLVMHKADTEVTTLKNKYTPLHIAATGNDAATVELLLRYGGASVNVFSHSGGTPLHFAAVKNSIKVAEILLKNGANVDCTDKCGKTPLLTASRYCHVNVIKLLLKYKANISAMCKNDKNSVLHILSLNFGEKSEEELVEGALLLLKYGASVNCLNNKGQSPIECALLTSENCKMDKLITVFILYGADIDNINACEKSAGSGFFNKSKLIDYQKEVLIQFMSGSL